MNGNSQPLNTGFCGTEFRTGEEGLCLHSKAEHSRRCPELWIPGPLSQPVTLRAALLLELHRQSPGGPGAAAGTALAAGLWCAGSPLAALASHHFLFVHWSGVTGEHPYPAASVPAGASDLTGGWGLSS